MVQDVLSGRVPGAFGHRFGHRRDAATAPASATVASAERDVTGSLSLVTKEGDTVTLSASFDASVTYAGLRRGQGGAAIATAKVSSSVSLQVQGDLSAQEMADIQKVVKRFLQDLRGMERGGQPSLANVTGVDATTLKSISATSSTTNTVTVAAVSARPLPSPGPAVQVAPDGDQEGGAQRAPLLPEDTGAQPDPAPLLSARGLVTPMPATPTASGGAASIRG